MSSQLMTDGAPYVAPSVEPDAAAAAAARSDPSPARIPKRRNRKTLSCTNCKERKIKCDRNVPGCNSCVIRGVQDQCRWGDERDERTQQRARLASSTSKGRPSKRNSHEGHDKRRHRTHNAHDQHRNRREDIPVHRSRGASSRARHWNEHDEDQDEDLDSDYASSPDQDRMRKRRKHRSHGVPDDGVQLIIQEVMKRLGKKESRRRRRSSSLSSSDELTDSTGSRSSTSSHRDSDGRAHDKRYLASDQSSRRSDERDGIVEPWQSHKKDVKDLLSLRKRPPFNGMARVLKMTAFGGFMPPNFFYPPPFSRETCIKTSVLAQSVACLPDRILVQKLVDVYMDEVEPVRNLYNRALMKRHMQEFWQDIDALRIATGTGAIVEPLPSHRLDRKQAYETVPLDRQVLSCTVPRQGLLACIFTLCQEGVKLMELDTLRSTGILSATATEEEATRCCEALRQLAQFHHDLSESTTIPTLWSMQFLMGSDFISSSLSRRAPASEKAAAQMSASFYGQRSALALTMAAMLGINRLGNGYDDAARHSIQAAKRNGRPYDPRLERMAAETTNKSDELETGAPETGDIGAAIRMGAWVTEFEDDLVHRELARKLWAVLVAMDCFVSSHLNAFHMIHDGIDATAPPCPVDDEDLLGPRAAMVMLESEPDAPVPRHNVACAYSLAFAKIGRQKIIWETARGGQLPYRDLLALDDRFQELFAALPPYLRAPRSTAVEEDALYAIHPSRQRIVLLQRAVLVDQAYFRLIHLHRYHLGRGFKDKQFRRSTLSCLEAAYAIFEAHMGLQRIQSVLRSAHFMRSHLVHAALVFQLILMHELERRQTMMAHAPHGTVYQHEFADIEETLTKLEACLGIVSPGSGDATSAKIKEFLPGLEKFLHTAKLRWKAQLEAEGRHRPNAHAKGLARSTGKAGTIPLTANPTSTVGSTKVDGRTLASDMPPPLSTPEGWPSPLHRLRTSHSSGSVSSPSTMLDAMAAAPTVASTGSSSNTASHGLSPSIPLDVYDPAIWSLDSLFPNYSDQGIDLLAALETELRSDAPPPSMQQVPSASAAHDATMSYGQPTNIPLPPMRIDPPMHSFMPLVTPSFPLSPHHHKQAPPLLGRFSSQEGRRYW